MTDNVIAKFQDIKMEAALRKIADIELNITALNTELETELWVCLAMCVDLAKAALGEKKDG
jgi:hypothetical protein